MGYLVAESEKYGDLLFIPHVYQFDFFLSFFF